MRYFVWLFVAILAGCLEPEPGHIHGDVNEDAEMFFYGSADSIGSHPLHPMEDAEISAEGSEESWSVIVHGYFPGYFADSTLVFSGNVNENVSVSAVILYGYPGDEEDSVYQIDWSNPIRCEWNQDDWNGDLSAVVSDGIIDIYWSELDFDSRCSFVLTDGHISAILP